LYGEKTKSVFGSDHFTEHKKVIFMEQFPSFQCYTRQHVYGKPLGSEELIGSHGS